jgi:hypothetical protein
VIENLFEDQTLGLDLATVVEVLPVAPAAPPEIRARRRAAAGTGFQDLQDFGTGIPLSRFPIAHQKPVAWCRKGDENDLSLVMSKSLATVHELLDPDFVFSFHNEIWPGASPLEIPAPAASVKKGRAFRARGFENSEFRIHNRECHFCRSIGFEKEALKSVA